MANKLMYIHNDWWCTKLSIKRLKLVGKTFEHSTISQPIKIHKVTYVVKQTKNENVIIKLWGLVQ